MTEISNNLSTNIVLGIGEFLYNIDLSEYYTINGKIMIITLSTDIQQIDNLNGYCLLFIGNKCSKIIMNDTTSYFSYSINGDNLVITSRSGYSYGVTGKICVL